MLSTRHPPGFQRCPSCASRIAADATTCPICGHEFPAPEPKPARTESGIDVSAARSAKPPGFSLAQLPWGVIGVVAVIAALAIAAVLLLRSSNLLAPTVSSTKVTIDGTQAAALPPQVTATPTTLAQTTATKAVVAPTFVPVPPTRTTVPPIEYIVKANDTCGGIADDHSIPLSIFLAFNNLNKDNCLIHIGDTVKIPPSTPTPGPSPTQPPGVTAQPGSTAEATVTLPPQIIIQVKSDDTCIDIAVRNHVSLDLLIKQNNLDANCALQIGQVLTVTFATPTPFSSPTPIVAQTPTPRIRFDAPQIMGPPDGAQITETEDIVTLQWLSTGLLKDNEWYVVQIQPSGAITVPIYETHATSIKLTRAIFGVQIERSFAWWVQVKQYLGSDAVTGERSYSSLSPPSAVRRFAWRRPAVPVTATPQ
jgi:LysM repeat protein